MNRSAMIALVLVLTSLAACGKSNEQIESEKAARESALQRTLAASVAEEREKDRSMRAAAAQQANDRIARRTRG